MPNTFEGRSIESANLDLLHEAALKVIEESRLKEKDFIDPNAPSENSYSKESIQKNLGLVQSLQKQFEAQETPEKKELKKIADIFEAAILYNSEANNWMGDRAFTVKTADFDDFVNGVDIGVEIRSEDDESSAYLGLGVDVTFSSNTAPKFLRIIEQIKNGNLAQVKFLRFDHMNKGEKIESVPEVIIGASQKTIMEVAALQRTKGKEAKEKLANHPLQIMILVQMVDQLNAFAEYCEILKDFELKEVFLDCLKTIDEILFSKQELYRQVAVYLDDDPVHYNIKRFLETWRKTMRANAA